MLSPLRPGDTMPDGSTVLAVGEPWRSSMGDLRQSFGLRSDDGRVRTGTIFLATGFVRVAP